MLPTTEALSEVMVDSHVIDSLAAGAIWVQMGTIGVEGTERLADEVSSRRPDVFFVDAPVSGSRQPTESGQLLVLASGPDGARRVLEPVFAAIATRTLWLGAAGSGTRLKQVLNTWLAVQVEAAAESAALAEQLGVAQDALTDALSGSPLASPLSMAKLAKIQAGDHSADFSLQWALKDLDLACGAVGPDHVPVAHDIAERWRNLVEKGFGQLDVSAASLGLAQARGDL
jgi:3-hydroxyisobutyrate dehydrogenase